MYIEISDTGIDFVTLFLKHTMMIAVFSTKPSTIIVKQEMIVVVTSFKVIFVKQIPYSAQD